MTATNYTGTVHFGDSAGAHSSAVPLDYTFTTGLGADNGVHVFTNGLTLVTAGMQDITATDTVLSGIRGSAALTVNPASAATLTVTSQDIANLTTAFPVTVTALDSYGNIATGYVGTVHFTSSDGSATLPGNYPFVSGDHGVEIFTSGVTLVTSYPFQTITATDMATGAITGSTAVNVTSATKFGVVTVPTSVIAGTPFDVIVTAETSGSSLASDYLGTVHFKLSDTAAGAVPPFDYTFTSNDYGEHTFSDVTLAATGTTTITATDSTVGSVTGSTTVSVTPSSATQLSLTAPATAAADTPFSVTVTALDPYGNIATSYTGSVHFLSTDHGGSVSLPSDYPFTSGISDDNGVHIFSSDVTLASAGYQMITAADTTNKALVGNGVVSINGANATHLLISGQQTVAPDVPLALTVTALDTQNNVATGYTGTVQFTTSDTGTLNAVQNIAFTGSPTGGTFILDFSGTTTSAITYSTNSTSLAGNIQSALNSLTGLIGTGNCTVSASSATSVNLAFQGTLAAIPIPTLTAVGSLTAGSGSPSISITTTQAGASVEMPVTYTFTAADHGIHVFDIGSDSPITLIQGPSRITVTTNQVRYC